MKTVKMFSLILGVLFLAGCASTKCKNTTPVEAPVAAPLAVVAPAPVAVPEPEVVPATEPAAEEVPAAVRKYVNK
jgi:uncharacterized lipoprotein YbaY